MIETGSKNDRLVIPEEESLNFFFFLFLPVLRDDFRVSGDIRERDESRFMREVEIDFVCEW